MYQIKIEDSITPNTSDCHVHSTFLPIPCSYAPVSVKLIMIVEECGEDKIIENRSLEYKHPSPQNSELSFWVKLVKKLSKLGFGLGLSS